tara:strand:- start:327 stop:572 length:246 start_codon:yes stop_codon:yes gene_type:complete
MEKEDISLYVEFHEGDVIKCVRRYGSYMQGLIIDKMYDMNPWKGQGHVSLQDLYSHMYRILWQDGTLSWTESRDELQLISR